ncbi:SDR family oxidoreductase [Acaryochloris marina]|uniref:Oxidoreductase, short-chain dehydrogenase/reductase family n=1 Tax=Acaryochloris marina (strain MBIC 11017) TaxID=329726 RepID=A8ZQH4_ACAM1|nr:SDR family oxidoreductase [Acaryochloris marina]ABW25290.1 oxidoreductase, short chain dehydrogenase/reductase family [Acaryochloris marina MBIC11017]ABW33260.1 oxidoreductase, short-chain dehydrogenase/reductase family [Acaryochloris marina MBIC11017]BDM82882.1 putative oxidoreductase YusZ [Acaryochloris marina MBIC10699]BDM83393.1 putative oxidoreductase YusZ [Acaryochloris marina MBIC10699]
MNQKTVLITGASSGFGKLAALKFQQSGWNVVATMRSPERETDLTQLENVVVTRLDVTEPASIEVAVKLTITTFGTIDVLVNNAGYGGHSLFEQATDENIRAMFETNVFGVMNVSRAVLPFMRQQKSGCIINVTSMAGMLAAPTISIYASTKHAVQGLTEGMAFDYKPFNIRVKSVLPGAYPTTRFNANTSDILKAGDAELVAHAEKLHTHLQDVAQKMANQGGQVADPQEVADKIFECATQDTPINNPVGSDAEMLAGMIAKADSRQAFIDQVTPLLMPPV